MVGEMTTVLNRQCHAAAAKLFGSEAHDQLRQMAAQHGCASWSDASDAIARQILEDLQQAQQTGTQLTAVSESGTSTRHQRDRIAFLRHSLHWPWSKIRTMVGEYGVSDWTALTVDQASHLIQRLEQIQAAYTRKRAHAHDHSA
jgi:hypothetical protein